MNSAKTIIRNRARTCPNCGYLNASKITEFYRQSDIERAIHGVLTGGTKTLPIMGLFKCPFCDHVFSCQVAIAGDGSLSAANHYLGNTTKLGSGEKKKDQNNG